MAWKFGNKVYRNLEEQVLENQKRTIKNEQDIEELKKTSPVFIATLGLTRGAEIAEKAKAGCQVYLKLDEIYIALTELYEDDNEISCYFTYFELETMEFFQYVIYADATFDNYEGALVRRDQLSDVEQDIQSKGVLLDIGTIGSPSDILMPAYGTTTVEEYINKVGYIVAKADNQYALCYTISDGMITFIFDVKDQDNTAQPYWVKIYSLSLDTSTDTMGFLFEDGFYQDSPQTHINNMSRNVEINHWPEVDEVIELPYNPWQITNSMPYLVLKVGTLPNYRYLRLIYQYYSNGEYQLLFDGSSTAADTGASLTLRGTPNSNYYTVVEYREV